MRESRVKAIRHNVQKLLSKKGLPFSKREFRRVKRFYTKLPWNKKEEFGIF